MNITKSSKSKKVSEKVINSSRVKIKRKKMHKKDSLPLDDKFFKQLLESLEDYVIFTTDRDGNINSWNIGAEKIFGYRDKEIIGKNAEILYVPNDRNNKDHEKELKNALRFGREKNERWHLKKNGDRFWGFGLVFPLKDSKGVVHGFTKVMRDLTERKKIAEEIKVQAQVLESMAEGVSISNKDGIIIYTNPVEDRLFGYRRGELIGQHVSIQNSYPPVQNKRIVGNIIRQLETKSVWSGEISNIKKDGTPFTTYARITAIEINGEKHWVCVQEDITQRKKAEQIIKKSEEQQKFLAKSSKILSSSLNYHHTLTKFAKLAVPAIADWCTIYIKEKDGKIKRLTIVSTDAKNSKIAEMIQSSFKINPEAREGVPEVIRSGKALLYDRPSSQKLAADVHEADELAKIVEGLGIQSWMCVPLINRKKIFGAISFKSSSSNRHYTKDDLNFVTELSRHAAIAIENARLYKEAKEEISERKKVEESLRYSEERFRSLIEQSTDAIQLINAEGKILYTSESIKKVLGYTPDELLGYGPSSFLHPEDTEYFNGKIMELLGKPKKQVFMQYRVKHKNGSWAWLETTGVNHLNTPYINALVGNFRNITERKKKEQKLKYQNSLLNAQREVSPEGVLVVSEEGKIISYNKRFVDIWKFSKKIMEKELDEIALQEATQLLVNPEKFIKRVKEIYKSKKPSLEVLQFKDGRIYDRYGSPVIGEDGTYYGYVWFFKDITERKRLERQKDDFIGIASHELKTPVTSIKAYTQVLHNRLVKEGNLRMAEHLAKVDGQLDKLNGLIGDLLDATKIDSGKLQLQLGYFDFNDLVNETVVELQRTSDKHDIKVILTNTKTVYADRDRVGQVIVNLLTNAIKYSPNSKKIIVRTYCKNNSITLQVQDFGIGIPKEKKDKVFERFYRVEEGENHKTYGGLGLGLFISAEIIRRLGGKLGVESKKGKGSTFSFTLPVNEVRRQKNVKSQIAI
jgi:PAS domain S-box-containing protein